MRVFSSCCTLFCLRLLNNWADEIGWFCRDLKTLSEWGSIQERMVLRKKHQSKASYPSYRLLVSSDKYCKSVKWQYMVLNEAQAIKSATSLGLFYVGLYIPSYGMLASVGSCYGICHTICSCLGTQGEL